MVPADDQAMVFPCASVMVIMVLLKVAFTCATPDAMFLRSRLRTRVASLPILDSFRGPAPNRRSHQPVSDRPEIDIWLRLPARAGLRRRDCLFLGTAYFFLPAIALAG